MVRVLRTTAEVVALFVGIYAWLQWIFPALITMPLASAINAEEQDNYERTGEVPPYLDLPGDLVPPTYVGPAFPVARVTGRYNIATLDVADTLKSLKHRLVYGLRKWTSKNKYIPFDDAYVQTSGEYSLWHNRTCDNGQINLNDPTGKPFVYDESMVSGETTTTTPPTAYELSLRRILLNNATGLFQASSGNVNNNTMDPVAYDEQEVYNASIFLRAMRRIEYLTLHEGKSRSQIAADPVIKRAVDAVKTLVDPAVALDQKKKYNDPALAMVPPDAELLTWLAEAHSTNQESNVNISGVMDSVFRNQDPIKWDYSKVPAMPVKPAWFPAKPDPPRYEEEDDDPLGGEGGGPGGGPPTTAPPTVTGNAETQLEEDGRTFIFCVQQYSTSVRWANPDVMNDWSNPTQPVPSQVPAGIHFTGNRDDKNEKFLIDNDARMWIVGPVWIYYLQLLFEKLEIPEKLDVLLPTIPGFATLKDKAALLIEDPLNKAISSGEWQKPKGAYFSTRILSMKDPNPTLANVRHKYIPICRDEVVPKNACMQITHTLFRYPTHISRYKLKHALEDQKIKWWITMQNITAGFSLQQNSQKFIWIDDPRPGVVDRVNSNIDEDKLWHSELSFPQRDWRPQKECKKGATCEFIPLAPSGRYMHTAITYVTWSHYDSYLHMCGGEIYPELCYNDQDVCHYNLTCLGGISEYFTGEKFEESTVYYRLAEFVDSDDGRFEPAQEAEDPTCPPRCCKFRRMCMRTHDVLGYEVPFERTMMLVFGGRTYVNDYKPPSDDYDSGSIVPEHHVYNREKYEAGQLAIKLGKERALGFNTSQTRGIIDKRFDYDPHDLNSNPHVGDFYRQPKRNQELIYHVCEDMNKELKRKFPQLRSCLEEITDELWRYDTYLNEWHFIKYDTSKSQASDDKVGTPTARYGHAAALIIFEKAVEQDQVRRQFMYIYGGAAQQCRFGLCDDLWRYEIPWAAIAYFPKFAGRGDDVDEVWHRGNKWFLKAKALCPHGKHCGRFRHSMTNSHDSQFLFVFGGQGIGNWENSLFRYRIFTDMWEDLAPAGVKEVVRFAFNYNYAEFFKETEGTREACCEVEPVTLGPHVFDVTRDDPLLVPPVEQRLCTDVKKILCGARFEKGEHGGQVPSARGDSQMTYYRDDYPLLVFGGFSTAWDYGERGASKIPRNFDPTEVDPDFERTRHYYEDTWVYTQGKKLWIKQKADKNVHENPKGRRGHSMVMRRVTTGDAQAILYGGQRQDEPLDDLWTYDVERDEESRKWQRLDKTFEYISVGMADESFGQISDSMSASVAKNSSIELLRRSGGRSPGKVAFHSAVWSEQLNKMLMFGGISWTETDLIETDTRMDRDRRCFKSAKDLPARFHDKAMALTKPKEDFFVLRADPDLAADLVRDLQNNCRTRNICCPLADSLPIPQEEDWKWFFYPDPDSPKSCWNQFTGEFIGKIGVGQPGQDGNGCRRLVVPLEKLSAQSRNAAGYLITQTFDIILRGENAGNTVATGRFFNLQKMEEFCRALCTEEMFIPVFQPNLLLGMWSLRPDRCPKNEHGKRCSGRGVCEFAHCVCESGWAGPDCSLKVCPGSTCYTDPNSQQQFCLECSQRGRCVTTDEVITLSNPDEPIDSYRKRICSCDAGWTGEDCSMAGCYKNCSSTPTVHRGVCLPEFPANQCVCAKGYYGLYCEKKFCLNSCSGNGQCKDGVCHCNIYWGGMDCSVRVFEPGRTATSWSTEAPMY